MCRRFHRSLIEFIRTNLRESSILTEDSFFILFSPDFIFRKLITSIYRIVVRAIPEKVGWARKYFVDKNFDY